MQTSRIPALVTVAVAAVLGVTGGASLSALADGETFADITAMMTTGVLSTAAVTGLALFVIRRWLAGYDARTRAALADVAAQHRAIEQQQAAHDRAMKERAAAVARESAAAQDQVRALNGRLDALAESRAAEHAELETLRKTNAEVLDEYNALVRETLQSGALQFVRKDCHQTAGPRLLHATELVPEPRGQLVQPTDTPAPAP